MKTKIVIGLLCLSIACGGVILLAQTDFQLLHNQIAQNKSAHVFPLPSLDTKAKNPQQQKEKFDSTGITVHLGGGIDPKTNFSIMKAPCDVLLTDPQGRRVGYDPTNVITYKEIPNAGYGASSLGDTETGDPGPVTKEIDIRQPIAGNYQIQVTGTGSGTYTLTVVAYDPDLNGSVDNVKNVQITPGEVHSYGFNYAKTVGTKIKFTKEKY